jgi:hypothetical protein
MAEIHPAASPHLPAFITAPGGTDVLMVVMGIILLLSVMMFGILFLRLHTLPERIAHKSHKLQFEIVAVLGLIALFTHMHIFWIAGLLLALIDLPDFGTSLNRIAGSTERMAGLKPGEGAVELPHPTLEEIKLAREAAYVPPDPNAGVRPGDGAAVSSTKAEIAPTKPREPVHA